MRRRDFTKTSLGALGVLSLDRAAGWVTRATGDLEADRSAAPPNPRSAPREK